MPYARKNPQASIDKNIKAHDDVASTYDSKHVEIYNVTEQNRTKSILREAVSLIKTGVDSPIVLDFGSGTGNLTRHLLDLQTNVIAGDVSRKSLDHLKIKFEGQKHLTTAILNGKNLIEFSDNCFDMVTTYSVLHHVPDYLGIIDEFVRVTKPGGIIYIDHEVCPSYWMGEDKYLCYLSQLGKNFSEIYQLEINEPANNPVKQQIIPGYLKFLNYRKMFHWVYALLNYFMIIKPAIKDEGDLHTSKNDHIEWHEIEKRLLPICQIIKQEDYLVCRERDYQPLVWNKWNDTCKDMRLIVAQKKSP